MIWAFSCSPLERKFWFLFGTNCWSVQQQPVGCSLCAPWLRGEFGRSNL